MYQYDQNGCYIEVLAFFTIMLTIFYVFKENQFKKNELLLSNCAICDHVCYNIIFLDNIWEKSS